MRNVVVLLAFLSVVLLMVGACRPTTPTPTATPQATATATPIPSPTATPTPAARSGGVLKAAQPGDPASCDLAMWRGVGFQSVHPCNLMLNQLVKLNPKDHGEVLPDLAEKWDILDGGTLWVFHLKPGIRWHDGKPLTAKDVKFSYDRVLNVPQGLQPGRAASLATYIDRVEAPDDLTVRIRTKFPAAAFLANLANVYASIYPEHVTTSLTPPTMERFEQVVGSGPFRYLESRRGSVYKVARFPDYFVRGRPYLDEVWYLVMPDANTQFAALESHQIDTIPVGILDAQANTVKTQMADRIGLVEVATANFWTVMMNTKTEPFSNPSVRRAVNLAIDRDAAIMVQGGGYKGAFMAPGGPWTLPEAQLMALPGMGNKEKERAQAAALLAQAGVSSGLKVTVLSRSGYYYTNLATFVIDQLKSIGIQGELRALEATAFSEALRKGDFQIAAHNHGLTLNDPDLVFFDHYLCSSGENYPQVCNPEIERMYQKQQQTLDPTQRQAIVRDMQTRMWDMDGKVIINWTVRRSPVWKDVHGFVMGASNYQGMRLEDVWKE